MSLTEDKLVEEGKPYTHWSLLANQQGSVGHEGCHCSGVQSTRLHIILAADRQGDSNESKGGLPLKPLQ